MLTYCLVRKENTKNIDAKIQKTKKWYINVAIKM